MKKNITIFDNYILNFKKNIIFKNSINYAFFKKLKFFYKKNLYINYFFYNYFIKLYTKNNYNIYFNLFFYKNLNFYYIYNLNFFKKQFLYDLNFLKNFFLDKKLNFLFMNKKTSKNFFCNNCFFFNVSNTKINFSNEFKDNFIYFNKSINLMNNKFNYNINFNLHLLNLIEFYKVFIYLNIYNISIKN